MRASPEVARVRQIIRTRQPLANVSLALGVPRASQDGLDTVTLTAEGAEVTQLLLTLDNERVAREHEAALVKAAAKAAKVAAKKQKELEVAKQILATWFPETVAASNQSDQHLSELKAAAATIVASATTTGKTVTVPVSDEIADLLYTLVV